MNEKLANEIERRLEECADLLAGKPNAVSDDYAAGYDAAVRELVMPLRSENAELREALTQICDGKFDGCYALMRDGKWHDLALALRDIATKALATHKPASDEIGE